MSNKLDYLEGQCEMLAKVCMELTTTCDELNKRLRELIDNHNELVQAVNDNTDFRVDFQTDMAEVEAMLDETIVFEPDHDAFRDKKKDH